jgi:hypothetical protein
LNSARIGEDAKLNKFQKNFSQKLVRSGKSSKNDKNEYKSSLGGLRHKPIGALNSARIGEHAKLNKFQKNFPQKLEICKTPRYNSFR